jgi:hypothetical protein
METATRQQLLEDLGDLDGVSLHEYVEGLPAWMRHCDLVLSMGGYNTLCEVMACARRSLVVPRVRPRREQELRARALERRGLLRVLHPQGLDAETLHRALRLSLEADSPLPPAARPPLDGAQRLREHLADGLGRRLLSNGAPTRMTATAATTLTGGSTGDDGDGRQDATASTPATAPTPHAGAGGSTSRRPRRGRSTLDKLAIVLGVVAWSSLAGNHANAGLNTLEAQLDFGHDGNLLNASDAERQAFAENDPDAFFVVSSMDDLFLRGRVEAEWGLGRPLGLKTKLRTEYERLQYFENDIKSENALAAKLYSRLLRSSRLGMLAYYRPQVYGRHRRDKSAEPGDPMFRAEVHSRWDLGVEWKQGIDPRTSLTAEWKHTWKDYNEPFTARDMRRFSLAVGAERGFGEHVSLGLAGGYRRAHTRNDPAQDDDRSYRDWALEPKLELFGIQQISRLQVSFDIRWRHYTSTNPEDSNHYRRDDVLRDLRIEWTRLLSRTLAVRVRYAHGWRSADIDAQREIDFDEEGSSTDDAVSAGLIWRWQR